MRLVSLIITGVGDSLDISWLLVIAKNGLQVLGGNRPSLNHIVIWLPGFLSWKVRWRFRACVWALAPVSRV